MTKTPKQSPYYKIWQCQPKKQKAERDRKCATETTQPHAAFLFLFVYLSFRIKQIPIMEAGSILLSNNVLSHQFSKVEAFKFYL